MEGDDYVVTQFSDVIGSVAKKWLKMVKYLEQGVKYTQRNDLPMSLFFNLVCKEHEPQKKNKQI